MRLVNTIKVILFLSLFSVNIIGAQQAQEYLEVPKDFMVPGSDSINHSSDVESKFVWIVHSDRANNSTSREHGGQDDYKTLDFLEKFYVIEEKGDFIRIARDPGRDGLKRSSQYEDYGWVHKSKMLLWRRCIVSGAGKIPRKAMVINTREHILSGIGGNPDMVNFTDNPESGGEVLHVSKLFEFYFVLKYDPPYEKLSSDESTYLQSRVLLGRKELVSGDSMEEVRAEVAGWAPYVRVTPWNHRVAVEPNWDTEALEERRNGSKAVFVIDTTNSRRYKNKENYLKETIIWNKDGLKDEENRLPGTQKRFPVLRTNENDKDLFLAGVMGDIIIFRNNEKKNVNDEVHAEFLKFIEKLENSLKNINIVFVVDGTTSMKPYFGSIQNAIKQCMETLAKNKNYDLHFGAAIYRDFLEGNRLFESRSLVSADNANEIISFLDPKKAYDLHDPDKPEALYYGLENALFDTGIDDENATNIIILAGDCGNREGAALKPEDSKASMDKVVQLLTSMNCHFLAFQVVHQSEPTYDHFIEQTREIIGQVAEKVYDESSATIRGVIDAPECVPDNNNPNAFKTQGGTFQGWIFGLAENSKLDSIAFTKQVTNFIDYFSEYVEKQRQLIRDMQNGKKINIGIGDIDQAFIDILNKYPQELLEKAFKDMDINEMSDDKFQVYTTGSTSMYVNGQKKPIYKYVQFLAKKELFRLVDQMGEFVGGGGNKRKKLHETWQTLLQSMLGTVSEEEMSTMTVEEIQKKVFDVPMRDNNILKNLNLQDILVPKKVSDEQIAKYCEDMEKKYREIFNIFEMDASDYKYSFNSNGMTFYWIDEDLLP